MPRPSKPRYIIKVTDWSNQETFLGTFTRHERAQQIADSINAGIEKRSDGNVRGHASVLDLDPGHGVLAMVEWALGYPDDETDEEQDEWDRRANAEIGGAA